MKIKLEIELKSGEKIDDIPGLKTLLESKTVNINPEIEVGGELKNAKEDLQRRKKEWWESVDEIVFLYIGFSLSFASEAMGNLFQPIVIWFFSIFILISIFVYVFWKWNYAFVDDS